jgi:phage/plasmid-associated DNA primase
MADMVQHPAKQGEVAIVMRGPEGCGKGTLVKALLRIFGQHGFAISNATHLTGRFNGHLRDCVLLFADEAFYAGDKSHIGVLKSLVTEPYLTIEAKYANPIQTRNYLHVIMASNEDWVVPASLRSRRWLVLDVSEARVGDLSYFKAIYDELDAGGHAAMLHDLLNRDISKSNLRSVPITDALQEQRKRSVDTITAWWLDCLHRGYVFASRLGLEDHWQKWHDFLTTEVLFVSYTQYCREHGERHPLSRELFGRWMASIGAKRERRRNQAVGEHLVEATVDGRSFRIPELNKHDFPTGYAFGTLDEARAAFCSWSGLKVEWDASL